MFVDQGLEQKQDIYTLDSLITWLEKQPKDGTYSYIYNCGCLLYLYLKHHNMPIASVGAFGRLNWQDGTETFVPSVMHQVAIGRGLDSVSIMAGWTFGQALDRAKKLRGSRICK